MSAMEVVELLIAGMARSYGGGIGHFQHMLNSSKKLDFMV